MALKKKPPPAGAPAWVLTYGDMMSLLLCFFILLAAFADYEAGGGSEAMAVALKSIQDALGIRLPNASPNATVTEFNAVIQNIRDAIRHLEQKNRGDSTDRGVYGRSFRLRRIRDGMEITIGGPVLFEPFSAELSPGGAEALAHIGEALAGHRNKIEIRGHAAEGPRPRDWTHEDAMRLSFERAARVAAELVRLGVDPRTIRLAACGANEPIPEDKTDPTRRDDNRRVEVFVRESVIDDYMGEVPASAGPAATAPGG